MTELMELMEATSHLTLSTAVVFNAHAVCSHLAVFVMHTDGHARLDFIQVSVMFAGM